LGTVIRYIRQFYFNSFNGVYFFLILLLLGLLIYLNYFHFLEIRLTRGNSYWRRFGGYYLLYFIPFAAAFFLQPLFFSDLHYFKNPWFWTILLLAPAFFSFRVNFDWQEILFARIWSGDALNFWSRCLNWIIRVVVVMLPVFIIWWLKDRQSQPFYGSKPLPDISPYWLMLLIMLPLVALAATQADFLSMYPRAKFLTGLDLPAKKWHYLLYELCYGFDFVSIEFFFRGFLILSLLKICGPHAIIPAACFYCSIHFGKPMGEAISSFWGGLVLGILSYNTGSIWGGLIVHLGVAWMMEIGGWLGLLLKR